ncbi:MAG: 1-acyl-sn-glycerol-3-phosphate acyltransferase [Clostridia bacterium]|nr:1-acyl-sn-glycerol-3-phosphate acyltransferase [Clostridia bacterium]
MSKKKKSKKKIGKANPLLYAILYTIFKVKFTKKYNITFDKDIVKSIKGPAIVVATHTSDQDHILSALTLYPIRPTYIVSEHFIRKRSTAMLLKLMHVITKKMFTPDISTIMNVLRAKNENSVIVIFGEGRLSCYGHTLPLAEGTAELIKKLGVNVYSWKAEGAYLTFPKWRDKGDARIGKIHCSVKQLLTAEEVQEKSIDEIKDITADAVLHDDELAMEGVEYKSGNIALGAEKILFKCPKCLKEDTITTEGNHIKCSCGLEATLDSKYRLHGAPFSRINEWFDWQQESMDTENGYLKAKAKLGCCDKKGFMDTNAGEGEVYMDKDIFKLSGTLHGEKIEFSVQTDKIGAFPISPGDHFDIYHNGNLIYVSPQPDPRTTVKWVCFLDNLMAKKRAENSNHITQ